MGRASPSEADAARDDRLAALAPTPATRDRIVQQWRDLREMLIRQLDMFETGGLTLRSNDENISEAAVADLKRSILEFDALISGET